MKNLILTIILLCACSCLIAQVDIYGTISNANSAFLTVSKSSSYDLSVWTNQTRDTFPIQGDSFAVKIELASDAFLSLNFRQPNKLGAGFTLMVSPGDQIGMHIDFARLKESKDYAYVQFEGDNADGHIPFLKYRRKPLRDHFEAFKKIFSEGDDATTLFQKFEAEMDNLLMPYQTLLLSSRIKKNYFKNVSDLIRSGAVSSILSQVYRNYWAADMRSEAERLKFVGLLLDYTPTFEEVNILYGSQFYYAANCFYYEKLFEKGISQLPQDYKETDTIFTFNKKQYTLKATFKTALLIEEEKIQEFYFANNLRLMYQAMQGMAKMYDETLDFFKAKFPQSKYTETIEWVRKENIAKAQQTKLQYDPSYEFIDAPYYDAWDRQILDDGYEMKDFVFEKDGINLTLGTYYITIWATWCRPCLDAMKDNYPVDSLLDSKNRKRLYISIDKQEDFMKWASKIDQYHLGGYHVLAGKELKQYLNKEFGTGHSIAIPRYIIMRDGEFDVRSAASPSDFNRLKEELESLREY
ncbi:MAG: hypothetical protein AAFO07_27575 [Bacteroidota bacterium]